MKAPKDLDPDVHTVLEIVQHAGEILARVPLAALRAHLGGMSLDTPHAEWIVKALNVCRAAEQLDAAQGILSAEEARALPPPSAMPADLGEIPDDWTVG